jgi:hypothetical protein
VRQRIRAHLTYANVISTICLFLLLGGGAAWAAGTIGAHDIKKNAVRSRHIKNGTVKAPDLAPISLVVSSVNVANHSQGQAGAQCPPGTRIIGGGGHWENFAAAISGSFLSDDKNAWIVSARNESGAQEALTAQAICLGK